MADQLEHSLWRGMRDTWKAYGGSSFQVFTVVASAVGGITVAFLVPASATGQEQALYGVAGAVGSAIAIGFLFLLWHCFRAPYRQRDEAYGQHREVQTKLQRLLDSIAYTLEVTEVVGNWPPEIQDGLGIVIRLLNRSRRAVRYQVKNLGVLIDNVNAQPIELTNNGVVIYERGDFTIPVLFAGMSRGVVHHGQVQCIIDYGLPEDRARRRLDVSVNITVNAQQSTVYWNRREEHPTDVLFTDDQPTWQSIPDKEGSQP